MITDFDSGRYTFIFDSDEFGDAQNADGTANLIVVDGEWDGTNDTGQAAFVLESDTGNLIYDPDGTDPGYTVVATVNGDVIDTDINFTQ